MRFKAITLLLLSCLLLISAGCGNKKGKEKMDIGEAYELPSGKEVKFIRVGEEGEKIEKLMTKTIEGTVKLVSNHPNPETLSRADLARSYILTLQRDGKAPILPTGNLTAKLKKLRNKKVTIVGVEKRNMPTINGIRYMIYEVKEIKEVEE